MRAICVSERAEYVRSDEVVNVVGFVYRDRSLCLVIVDATGRAWEERADHFRLVADGLSEEQVDHIVTEYKAERYRHSVALLQQRQAREAREATS